MMAMVPSRSSMRALVPSAGLCGRSLLLCLLRRGLLLVLLVLLIVLGGICLSVQDVINAFIHFAPDFLFGAVLQLVQDVLGGNGCAHECEGREQECNSFHSRGVLIISNKSLILLQIYPSLLDFPRV